MTLPKELTKVTPLSKYLAMLVFIIIPFVGFFLGMRYQEMTDLITQQMNLYAPASVKREITPTLDITSNWKTYTNNKYGFSIQYPSNWTGESYKSGEKPIAVFISDKFIININRHGISSLPKEYINVTDWFNDLKMKQKKAIEPNDGFHYGPGSDNPYQWYMQYRLDNIKETLINQYPALITLNSNTFLTYIIIPHDQYIYEVAIQVSYKYSDPNKPKNSYDDPIVKQILSTFKFLGNESAEGKVCGGPVLEPCSNGYVCQTQTLGGETSGICVKQ